MSPTSLHTLNTTWLPESGEGEIGGWTEREVQECRVGEVPSANPNLSYQQKQTTNSNNVTGGSEELRHLLLLILFFFFCSTAVVMWILVCASKSPSSPIAATFLFSEV